jgi:YVTN family beta-propeller protein
MRRSVVLAGAARVSATLLAGSMSAFSSPQPAPADGVREPDGLEWIPNQGDGTVSLVDPASNAVVGTVHSGGLPFVVRVVFGSMWVDDFTGRTLSRFRPAA